MKQQHYFTFILALLFHTLTMSAQDCGCTISEVQNNLVQPCDRIIGEVVTVGTANALIQAIRSANATGGNMTILIEDGTYQVATTASYPYITANNLVIRSLSGDRDAVILTGTGMKSVNPLVEIGLSVVGNNITIADLTIRDVGNHGISTQGDSMFVHNVRIQNTYEQMLKGTAGGDGADNAIVQCSLFEYPGGVGPNWYIGGLDIHRGDNWVVRDNIFKNIISPSTAVAEHAIHFWNRSSNNTIERNWIVNCDRGIGFGLGDSPHEGGIIRNNMIYNDGQSEFSDVGIGLESSSGAKVYNNTIFITYPNAIEYRFATSRANDIQNNLTNRQIRQRNGGMAMVNNNFTKSKKDWFVNVSTGDLHLVERISSVVDQGASLLKDVPEDFDQVSRPKGIQLDIGAHEYEQTVAVDETGIISKVYQLFPNPANTYITISTHQQRSTHIEIYRLAPYDKIFDAYYQKLSSGIINIENWLPGLYICRITDGDQSTQIIPLVVSPTH